jgi:hypothetical protein
MWRSSRSDNARRYAALLVFSMAAPALVAQVASTPVIPYGTSLSGDVRLRAPSIAKLRIFGTVERATRDTLVLRSFTPAGADTIMAIPVAAITRLQLATGTHSNAGKGFGIGLLAGGLAGAGIGALSCRDEGNILGSSGCAKVLGVLGAGAGAIVGLIVGATSRSNTWGEVRVQPVGVSLLHLGVRLTF